MNRTLFVLLALASCAPAEKDAPPVRVPPVPAAPARPEPTLHAAPQRALALEPFYSAEGVLDSVRVLRGGRPLQTLLADGDSEPVAEPGEDLAAVDIDLDGYLDVRQRTIRGATGNVLYRWWLFDADSGRLVDAPDYTRLIGAHTIDAEARRITTRSVGGHAGAIFEEVVYTPRGRALVRVQAVSQDFDPATERYVRTSGRAEGAEWIVQVDTLTREDLVQP